MQHWYLAGMVPVTLSLVTAHQRIGRERGCVGDGQEAPHQGSLLPVRGEDGSMQDALLIRTACACVIVHSSTHAIQADRTTTS